MPIFLKLVGAVLTSAVRRMHAPKFTIPRLCHLFVRSVFLGLLNTYFYLGHHILLTSEATWGYLRNLENLARQGSYVRREVRIPQVQAQFEEHYLH